MTHWSREPLLHFLIAGALLFGAHAWISGGNEGDAEAERVVHVTSSQVEWLAQAWARQWGRPPTDAELEAVVAGHLKEELLAREARALGLDENDTVVRRRLAQKMEFLVQDTTQAVEPSDEELRQLYASSQERLQTPARISFTHVYFNRDRRGVETETEARATLRRLTQSDEVTSASDLGDRFLVSQEFWDADEREVASVFGPEFAGRVFAIEPGGWQGPIESGYGVHLVRVTSKQGAQPREFASVREEVLTLWRQQREEEAREQYFAALLERYDVIVDESVMPLVGPPGVARKQSR